MHAKEVLYCQGLASIPRKQYVFLGLKKQTTCGLALGHELCTNSPSRFRVELGFDLRLLARIHNLDPMN